MVDKPVEEEEELTLEYITLENGKIIVPFVSYMKVILTLLGRQSGRLEQFGAAYADFEEDPADGSPMMVITLEEPAEDEIEKIKKQMEEATQNKTDKDSASEKE